MIAIAQLLTEAVTKAAHELPHYAAEQLMHLHEKKKAAREENDRGVALSGRGLWAPALAAFVQAATMDPGLIVAFSNQGVALRELSRNGEALDVDRAVMRAHPGDAQPHNACGVDLIRLNRPRQALVEFEAAIALDPDHANAQANRELAAALLQRRSAARKASQAQAGRR